VVVHRKSLSAFLLLLASTTVAAESWTLERAVEQAIAANPDARIARSRIAAADAGIEQARSAFLPHVQVGSDYVWTDNPVRVFGAALNQGEFDFGFDFNDPPAADNLNVNAMVLFPLYRGGSSAAGREGAEARLAASRHQDEAVRRILELETARAFFTVRKTREFVRAAEGAVQAFESNVEIARKRYAAGTALKTDVLDVEVRLAGAREDLVRAKNANTLARRAMRNLLAIEDEEVEIAAVAPVLQIPDPTSAPIRPELAAAAERRAMVEASERGARAGRLPRVDAFGRYDVNRGWEFDGSGNNYAAGVQLKWTVWDGKRTSGLVHETRAELDAAVEQERKLRLAVDLELAEARLGLREAEERLAVTAKTTSQAEESAELTRARFEQGLALATQVIDAETALMAARVRRAEAEADREIAVAALRKALGLPLLSDRGEDG